MLLIWLLFAMMLLTGCGAIVVPREGFDPPFDEEVLESLLGSTRNEVEEQLGRPLFMGYKEDKNYFVYGGHIDTTGMIVGVPTFPIWSNESICSLLEFGADERLTRYETLGGSGVHILPFGGVGDAPENCKEAFWTKDELAEFEQAHKEDREKRAQGLAPHVREVCEVPFEIAVNLGEDTILKRYKECLHRDVDPKSRIMWTCLLAHAGRAEAQSSFAWFYRYETTEPNHLLNAFKWYRLAKSNDYSAAGFGMRSLSAELSPSEISEAEVMAKEWQPDPAECELEAKAKN